MKKIIALFLAASLTLSAVGCAGGEKQAALESELQTAQEALAAAQTELNGVRSDNAQMQTRLNELESNAALSTVNALHATIDGKSSVQIQGETTLTAHAVLTEGQVVDHWELDGQIQEGAEGQSFTFTASGNTTVEAVLRAEKKITTVNCEITLLDADGKVAGDSYEEFCFENTCQNPVTGEEITDGTISFQVKAVIPGGYEVDYWKINGVEYHIGKETSFIVKNLDEATEYEAVLKEIPIVYYRVTCEGCQVNGSADLYVPAGTTLTAISIYGSTSGYFYLNGAQMNSGDNYRTSFGFTVNSDCHVRFRAIIN